MANDIYALRIFWADSVGRRAENVLHYQLQTPPSSNDPWLVAGDLIDAWLSTCETDLLACLAASETLQSITALRVSAGGGPTNLRIKNDDGTRTGNLFSQAVALNIAMLPSVGPYRRKEGHQYVPGIVDTDLTADIIIPALRALVNTYIADLGTVLTGTYASYENVIFDRTTKIATPVADYILRPTITPMRRRLKPRM